MSLSSFVPQSSSLSMQPGQRQLLRMFWLILISLVTYELFWAKTESLSINFGAALITIAALLPSYLWCSGRAHGMPVFPFFALTYVWTYGLPLVINHPVISTYAVDEQFFASLTTTAFLVLGTIVWFQFVKVAPLPAKSYRALNERSGNYFFFWILGTAVLFNVANNAGWLSLQGGIFSAIRSAVLGLTALASFVLAYRIGTKELSRQQSSLFIFLLMAYMISSAVGLLLIGAASTSLIATIAFTIGRKKIPVFPIVIMFACLSFLHYGKAEMRSKYWFETETETQPYVQPWEYPAWYAEWSSYALNYFNYQEEQTDSEEKASFLERSSVIQMLMLAQVRTPEMVPFMYGETYAILPQVIVPRILNPNKIWAQEGTSLLNIHYGLQTREQTTSTTIGWGLLAESYANFGVLGCLGLAAILGAFYGRVTRWSINAPILSVQSLYTIIMMTFAFQSEWSAGVYVAALFQSSMVLLCIVLFLMKTYWTPQPVVFSSESEFI